MLTFRPLTSTDDDLAAANLLLQSAFQADTNWGQSLRRYIGWQPDGWIMALENDQPVAMVGAVDYGTYAYIGMMAVHESQQRRGIGMQVMEQILAHLDRKGCPIVLLDATKSGAGLYTKLGFTKKGVRAVFDYRAAAPPPPPDQPYYVLSAADLEEVIAFDRPIFGGDRRRMLEAQLEDHPDRGLLTRGANGEITGYLFADERRLAPFIAATPQTAETLLRAGLQLSFSVLPGVIAPLQNKAALDLLVDYGFVSLRNCAHMQRGGSEHPQQVDKLYGQLSYAVG